MPRPLGEALVFEVFLRTAADPAVGNVGSVEATDTTMAWELARDAYGRRDDLVELWVASRADITTAAAADRPRLAARTRMPHRQPAFPMRRREQPRGRTGRPAEPAETTIWAGLADDLFLNSHLLAARLYEFVAIETSLACGSIAQECLVHAGVLAQTAEIARPALDQYFFDRSADRWRPAGIWFAGERCWPTTVASGLLLSVALGLVLVRCGATGDLEQVAVEQAAHLAHWRHAVAGFLADDSMRAAFADRFGRVLRSGADLFGLPPLAADPDTQIEFGHRLAAAGIPADWLASLPSHPQPRGPQWADQLAPLVSELNLVRRTYSREAML